MIREDIVTPEPITDYLTRFSGIEIGDLDPTVSTKPLTTLKAVYLKLRYLVDRGMIEGSQREEREEEERGGVREERRVAREERAKERKGETSVRKT